MKLLSKRHLALAAAFAASTSLVACNEAATGAKASAETTKGTETLSAALAGNDDLSTFSKAVKAVGVASVFDGPGSYTILAPSDEAFDALGDSGKALFTDEQKPVLAGIIRDHILPGHLTAEDVSSAIATKGGSVTMKTLGGGSITFSKEGDALYVASGDGAKVKLDAKVLPASNGVVIPVGGVILPPKEG